jgi:hypothetical protein
MGWRSYRPTPAAIDTAVVLYSFALLPTPIYFSFKWCLNKSLISPIKIYSESGGMAQVLKYLPGNHEALSANLSTAKILKKYPLTVTTSPV